MEGLHGVALFVGRGPLRVSKAVVPLVQPPPCEVDQYLVLATGAPPSFMFLDARNQRVVAARGRVTAADMNLPVLGGGHVQMRDDFHAAGLPRMVCYASVARWMAWGDRIIFKGIRKTTRK